MRDYFRAILACILRRPVIAYCKFDADGNVVN